MTNREDEGESSCETRFAALLAVHLVSQVLDEAYVIVNAATETGQPWRYLAMLKNVRSGKLGDVEEEDLTDCACIGDSSEASKMNEVNVVTNVVAASTPQKASDEAMKVMNDTSFIGQGDEELTLLDMRQNELNTSTSMFINHLFDMSEVESVIICKDTEVIQSNPEPNDLLTEAMTKIMESYVNTALGIAFGQNIVCTDIGCCTESQVQYRNTDEKSPSTEFSGYSFLADAFTTETANVIGDVAFCVENEIIYCDKDVAKSSVMVSEIIESSNKGEEDAEIELEENPETEHNKSDVTRYENAYLTLNRDYDQCSDDYGDPILQDPKGMFMQDVELITMQTSDENSSTNEAIEKNKELTAISGVSASSRKSSLVQRCRTQGARLLACLRGWWRRKTPGKRREARVPGSVRGLCPLSPDARRRAASLLDQRRLCASPDPAQHVVWKFNTVSEALVNSSRWKNYTFDVNSYECGEY